MRKWATVSHNPQLELDCGDMKVSVEDSSWLNQMPRHCGKELTKMVALDIMEKVECY